jgi:hypothetical protein
MSEEQNLPDVETINGYAVGFSFLRFYRLYPEIGLPVAEQVGDVGGYQKFENAELTWNGEKVECKWLGDEAARPEWLEGQNVKEFEV